MVNGGLYRDGKSGLGEGTKLGVEMVLRNTGMTIVNTDKDPDRRKSG